TPEFIKKCEKVWGKEEFQKRRENIFSINANNDYVHGLGNLLALEKNTIWLKANGCEPPNVANNHFITSLINPDGSIVTIDPNGSGPVAKFVHRLSEQIMRMSPNDRESSCLTIMGILQAALGGELPVNSGKTDWLDFVAQLDDGAVDALTTTASVLLFTEEGQELRTYLADYIDKEQLMKTLEVVNALKQANPKFAAGMFIVGSCFLVSTSILVTSIAAGIHNVCELAEKIRILRDTLFAIAKAIGATILMFLDALDNAINQLKNIALSWISWLQDKFIDKQVAQLSIPTDIVSYTGLMGIDYDKVDVALYEVNTIAGEMRYTFPSLFYFILDQLSFLRYTSVDSSSIISCEQKIQQQIILLNQHSLDLAIYKDKCKKLDNEFTKRLKYLTLKEVTEFVFT
ncbi:MAG: hypothetical protein WAX04_07605, partial [Oscillospiraceae bacterium]